MCLIYHRTGNFATCGGIHRNFLKAPVLVDKLPNVQSKLLTDCIAGSTSSTRRASPWSPSSSPTGTPRKLITGSILPAFGGLTRHLVHTNDCFQLIQRLSSAYLASSFPEILTACVRLVYFIHSTVFKLV